MTAIGSYVRDQHLLGLSVDGNDVPMDLANMLELQITENVQQKLPAFRWRYRDKTGFLHDTAPISDGTTVGIIMHSGSTRDPEDPSDMQFRTTGSSADPAASAMNHRVAGTLDKVKFLGSLAKMPIMGTSAEALKKIAQTCSLKFEGESTQDKMPWLPRNQSMKFSDFASFIALHGYGSAKSAMSMGVTDDGRLMFKDLNKAVTKSGNRRIVPMTFDGPNDIPYVHWKVISINGFSNLTHGQGIDIAQEKIEGGLDILNLIESLFSGNGLNVSDVMSKLLGGPVLKEFIPFDMKNTAPKFYQAKNQNIRGRALFSNVIEVLTTQATGLHIYDTVDFDPILPSTNKPATLYAGSYVVSARTRYIEKKRYWEKLRLQSNSGGKGGAGMKGGQ